MMRKMFFLFSIAGIFCPGIISADEIPVLESVSIDHVSMVDKYSFDERIVIEGQNLDRILFDDSYELWFGDREPATALSGNDAELQTTFSLTPEFHVNVDEVYIRLLKDGELVQILDSPIRVINPIYDSYRKGGLKKFLHKTNRKKASKRTVGLNVHWALGAQGDDELYEKKLDKSHTKWAREFIAFDTFVGESRNSWIKRYDTIFDEYEQRHIRVVAMLAYGDNRNGADRYIAPNQDQWEDFVRTVTQRYRNQVDAWEVWNEPDNPTYMHGNSLESMHNLLKWSYPLIKHYDPTSTVLNGPIASIENTEYVHELYQQSGQYFDELAIHLYYCDEYVQYGNSNEKLFHDIEQLRSAIPENKRSKPMWITEMGCSLGTEGIDTQIQRTYLQKTTKHLLKTGYFRTILLFDFRDRPDLNDPYESNFGLMDYEGVSKPAWKWYRRLPKK